MSFVARARSFSRSSSATPPLTVNRKPSLFPRLFENAGKDHVRDPCSDTAFADAELLCVRARVPRKYAADGGGFGWRLLSWPCHRWRPPGFAFQIRRSIVCSSASARSLARRLIRRASHARGDRLRHWLVGQFGARRRWPAGPAQTNVRGVYIANCPYRRGHRHAFNNLDVTRSERREMHDHLTRHRSPNAQFRLSVM